jgi:NitT/TauT family transport system permease protein
MAKVRIDRTSIFLGVVVVLFFWDLVYFLGITDTDHLPHPFRVFRLIGDSDVFRGFRSMLRQMIFLTLPGSVVGIAVAHRVLLNPRVSHALLRFLRIGIWIPVVLLFTVPSDTVTWAVTTAALCSCYNYLVGRSLLNFRGRDIVIYVGRETVLQLFFFFMLAQLELRQWIWMHPAALFQPATGVQVVLMIVIFVAFINWIFYSNFEAAANTREIIIRKELETANRRSLLGAIVIVIASLLIWQTFSSVSLYGSSVSPIAPVSPLDATKAAYNLFGSGEIWLHMQVSLIEILLGVFVCCLMAFAFGILCIRKAVCSILFLFLPLTSPPLMLVAYSSVFILVGIGLWEKALAVAFLTFYPFFETWWALTNHSVVPRILMALDHALPFAFVAMLFGEAMASTAGLGFSMFMHTYYRAWDKAFAVHLITVGLLVCLSSCLRWIARRFYAPAPPANAIRAQAA